MHAAALGHHEAVKLLVAAGANARLVDKDGQSPLVHAANSGSTRSVAYLLEQGNADPNDMVGQGVPLLQRLPTVPHRMFVDGKRSCLSRAAPWAAVGAVLVDDVWRALRTALEQCRVKVKENVKMFRWTHEMGGGDYSITHGLLAGLRLQAVVTTNYDTLFEAACAGAQARSTSASRPPDRRMASCDLPRSPCRCASISCRTRPPRRRSTCTRRPSTSSTRASSRWAS